MGNCCEANICYEISRLPLSIHSCQNFKCHSKWNQHESKILKKRNGTWIPARHPCQLSQNLLAILTMSQRVAVTNHNHLILAPKMSWPSLEHSCEAKICREFSRLPLAKISRMPLYWNRQFIVKNFSGAIGTSCLAKISRLPLGRPARNAKVNCMMEIQDFWRLPFGTKLQDCN